MARLPSGLDARRTRAEWSPEAVKRLILLHVQCGNKWTEISRRLKDDRSENEVKNFFYGALKAKRGFRHPLLQAYARALPVTVDKGGPDAKSRTAAYKYAKQLMASEGGEPFDDRSFDATIDVERELAAIGASQQQADVMAVDAAGHSFGGRHDYAIGSGAATGGAGVGGYDNIGLRAVGSSGDLHGGGLGGAAHRLPLQPFDALLPGAGSVGGAETAPLRRLAGLDSDAPAGDSLHMMAPLPLALPAPHARHHPQQQQHRQSLQAQQYGGGDATGGPLPLLRPQAATHRLSDEGPEPGAGWREGSYGGPGAPGDRSRVMAALELYGEGRPPVDSGAPGAWGAGFPPPAHRQSGPLLPRAGSSHGLQHQPLQPRYSDRDPADLDHQWSGGIQNAVAGPLSHAGSGGPAGGLNIGGYGFRRSDEVNNWDQQPQAPPHLQHPPALFPAAAGSELLPPVGGGPRGFPHPHMQAQQQQQPPQQQPQGAQGRWSGGTGTGTGMDLPPPPRLDSPVAAAPAGGGGGAGYRRDSSGFAALPPPLHQHPHAPQQPPPQWAQQQDPPLPGLAAGGRAQQQPAAAGFAGPSSLGGGGGSGGGGPGGPAGPHPFGAFVDSLEGPLPGAAGGDAPGHHLGSPTAPAARLNPHQQQHSLPQRHYSGSLGGGGAVGDAAGNSSLQLPQAADTAAAHWDNAGRDHQAVGLGPAAPAYPRHQQHPPYGRGSYGADPEPVRDPYGGGGGGQAAPPPQGPGSRPSSGPQPHFQHPQPHPQHQHHHQQHPLPAHQQPHIQQQQQAQRGDPGVQRILSDVRETRQRWGDEDLVWQAMQARRRQHQLLLLQNRQQAQPQPHHHHQQQQQHPQQHADPPLGPGSGLGLGGLGPDAGDVRGGPSHHGVQQQQQQRHPVPSPFELPWPGSGSDDQDVGRGATGPGPLALPAPPLPMGRPQQPPPQQQDQPPRQAPGAFQEQAPFMVSTGGVGEGMPPPAQSREPQGPPQHHHAQQHSQPFGSSAPGTMPPPSYGQDPALGPMGAAADQPPLSHDAVPQFPLALPPPPYSQPQAPQSQPHSAAQVPPPPPHPAQGPATSGLQVSSGSDLFVPGTFGGGFDEGRFGATRLPRPDSSGDLGGPHQHQQQQGGAGGGHMALPPPSLPPAGAGAASNGAGGGPAAIGGETGFNGDTPGGPGLSFGGGYTPSDGAFDGWGPAGGVMPPPQTQPHQQQQHQQHGFDLPQQPSPQRGPGGLSMPPGMPTLPQGPPMQQQQPPEALPQGGAGGMW